MDQSSDPSKGYTFERFVPEASLDPTGEKRTHHDKFNDGGAVEIRATPFIFRDPKLIPPREPVYGKHLIRQFLSTLIAHGGVGKSALQIAEALSMASGKPLLGIQPAGELRVWYWNGEDPLEEIERRVAATMQQYDLTPEDIDDRLYIDSGRRMPIILANQTRSGTVIAEPVVEAVIRTITENRIDVVSIDPFVSSHRVTENDNNAIEAVAKQWAQIADVTGCAVELAHHSRKTGGAEVTVEDGRGAVALLAAARAARTLNVMSSDEAIKAGVDNPRWYFRIDNGKANLSPPADEAAWCRFVSVHLANGDSVGVPVPWAFPDAFEGVTASHLPFVQKAVAEGGPWRKSEKANDWVGYAVAPVLGLDPKRNKGHKHKITTLLAVWIENGVLVEYTERDPKRRDERTFVKVGEWV